MILRIRRPFPLGWRSRYSIDSVVNHELNSAGNLRMLHTGLEVRRACREGSWTGPTCGLAPGYAQANLVMLPQDWAFEFLLFCQRNPRPCPLLEVTTAGSWTPSLTAPDADLRSDLPGYRVWQNGELVDEPADNSCLLAGRSRELSHRLLVHV